MNSGLETDKLIISNRMSDAGDEIPVEAATVEVAAEPVPKGKLSVEDALQVWFFFFKTHKPNLSLICVLSIASIEKRSRSRRSGTRSP